MFQRCNVPCSSKNPGWVAALLLLLTVHIFLLAYSATRHSPVFVEGFNLVAGVQFWQTGQNDLFTVNPPLSRMVGALPVVIAGAKTNCGAVDTRVSRPEYLLAEGFIEANGPRTFWLFTLARWACIPFSVIGAIVCFLWARDLYGASPGVLAATLWCFSPDILGHGALVTADGAATSIGVLGSYVYWRWLRRATWPGVFASGLGLGFVLLTKTTWIILVVLWPVLWFAYHTINHKRSRSHTFRQTLQLVAILVLGISVFNAAYGFQGSFRRLGQYDFVSRRFGGPSVYYSHPSNRFRDTCFAALPVPLPEPYMRGIDLQAEDFEKGYQCYLGGQWRSPGWWYYYLYAFAIKTPLGTHCLLVLAFVSVFQRRYRSLYGWCDTCCLLLPSVAVFAVVSSQTGLNAHFRYVLPALPFLFIWSSKVGQALQLGQRKLAAAVVALVAWVVVSSLWIYPHSLSYFNEVIRGPRHGHHYLLYSNIDWGQDLLYFGRWLSEHPDVSSPGFAYHGVCSPRIVGIQARGVPPGPRGDTILEPDRLGPQPGWYAVSVNRLHEQSIDYSYFFRFEPIATAGYSIYIYHLALEQANHVRRELGLPELTTERRGQR